MLGFNIFWKSFMYWINFYEQTKCVVHNPEMYEAHDCSAMLMDNECMFMIGLVWAELGLFLSEIQEHIYNSTGMLLSIAALHHNLVNSLLITLKKSGRNNVRNFLVAKYSFFERMMFFPDDWLVFTGKLPSFFPHESRIICFIFLYR